MFSLFSFPKIVVEVNLRISVYEMHIPTFMNVVVGPAIMLKESSKKLI